VNYVKQYGTGLHVGTSMTEGTANSLVNRRMNKPQRMRWSRTGADLLLQVPCAIHNGALGSMIAVRRRQGFAGGILIPWPSLWS
jgi:hypothetical protein